MVSGEIGVGVVGLGFMGQTHVRAWQELQRRGEGCRLITVADRDSSRLTGKLATAGNLATDGATPELLFDSREVFACSDPIGVIADPRAPIVSICTPTDTHVELAIRALEYGKHVLVEKPLAIRAADIERLRHAARSAKTLCMPALCMRFWPGWDWLKQRVDSGAHGRVRSAVFQRLGSQPNWSGFYRDPARTGGALVDLHIHDADFIRWCFGDPVEVVCAGGIDHLTTLYRFPDGPAHVVAEGAWGHSPGFRFRMRYIVVFERGTADFDLTRTPQLLWIENGQAQEVPLGSDSAYLLQARHLLRAVQGLESGLRASVEDGWRVARLLDAERESLAAGRAVPLGQT
jgi:predicted dehydrogenase